MVTTPMLPIMEINNWDKHSPCLKMPVVGVAKEGNPMNGENILHQELDDHAMIVAMQKEMKEKMSVYKL